MKVLHLEIERCAECMYPRGYLGASFCRHPKRASYGDAENTLGTVTDVLGNVIFDGGLPPWCPLPDKEEKK